MNLKSYIFLYFVRNFLLFSFPFFVFILISINLHLFLYRTYKTFTPIFYNLPIYHYFFLPFKHIWKEQTNICYNINYIPWNRPNYKQQKDTKSIFVKSIFKSFFFFLSTINLGWLLTKESETNITTIHIYIYP